MEENVKEYFMVFGELPPKIFMLGYEEEHYTKLINLAVKRDKKLTLGEVSRMITFNKIEIDLVN